MEKTVASKVPFKDLCRLCEKICDKVGQQNKEKVLSTFIKQWRDFHAKLHDGNPKTEDSFYPALRLLLPKFEKERSAYGIKEVTLARLYIEILVLNKDGDDAQSLLKFKTQQGKVNAGDFASVAFMILKNRCPDDENLTVQDVNKHLDDIAVNSAARQKDEVKKNLMHLLKNTSALEQKWLIRMIMKDMKMGMSEKSILNAFHLDAKDLFDVSNSLSKVCSTLKDPQVRLHEVEISIFNPFRPMLGERSVPEKVEKLMENKAFYIETKFDGERMQLHKRGSEYKFFSRSGNDYSHAFGSSSDTGTVAPHIHHLFNSKVTSCILDGEMMGYNSKTDTIGNKGQNFDVKFLQEGQDMQPFYCVFDILLYNGKVLSNLPLSERVTYLKDLFKPVKGRLQISEQKVARSKDEVVEALNEAIDNLEEGLVVKSVSSLYKPNTRKGGWLKIKPEYVDGLMDQLDLIIIGGYFGEGRRSGMVSHFLLGVADATSSDDCPKSFHSFCKVGSGYSLQELHELGCKLKDHWKVYNKKSPPSNILLANGHKEKPDLFIEPSKSFILQVKAAEINASDRFKTECTLRFPRVEHVRYDKPWHQCMTLSELKVLREQSSGKLASKHMLKDGVSDNDLSPKKKHAKTRAQQPIVIAPHFRPADLSTITQESELFKNLEVCIINDSPKATKQELEKAVARHGGTVVQNPGASTSFILSSKLDLRTKNLVKYQVYDVVKTQWLQRCIEEKRYIPKLPSDMLHSTDDTARVFAQDFDQFGDSFYEDVDAESLKKIFDGMKAETVITNGEIAEIEQKYFPNSSPLGLFHQHSFYFDSPGPSDDDSKHVDFHRFQNKMAVCLSRIKLYGGTIRDKLDLNVSHVVVNEEYLSHLKDFRAANRKRKRKFHIVTKRWVYDSIKHNYLLSERKYEPL